MKDEVAESVIPKIAEIAESALGLPTSEQDELRLQHYELTDLNRYVVMSAEVRDQLMTQVEKLGAIISDSGLFAMSGDRIRKNFMYLSQQNIINKRQDEAVVERMDQQAKAWIDGSSPVSV